MKFFSKTKKHRQKQEDKAEDYAKLGKALTRAIVRDNIQVTHNWKRFITINFVRGLFVGLGSVVGATLLVAIALWLLNVFGGLPVIGELFESLQESLQRSPRID